VVLGLLHRFSLQNYALLVEDYGDIMVRAGGNASSVGEAILKSFEQLVYSGPEQWYQWNKYAQIEDKRTLSSLNPVALPAPILRPAYVDAS
jgi:hypothetical protein